MGKKRCKLSCRDTGRVTDGGSGVTVVRDLLLTRQVRYRFARDSYRQTCHFKSPNLRIEVGFVPEPL
jgi:hypothetical protein